MGRLNLPRIKVWDIPVRLGHWMMAAGFILAWYTADSEEWRLVHVYAGSTVLAVAMFRLLWGFIGSRHARFTAFVRGPAEAVAYLHNLGRFTPEHYTGHNPAGGLAIVALLTLALLTCASGWFVYQDMLGEWVSNLHDLLAEGMLVLVIFHLLGVAVGSLAHKENLVLAMITGRKPGVTNDAIHRQGYLAAILLLGWTGICIWWLAQ